MKISTLSIFLFLGLSAFSVNYYVDSAAMGTHKGTSWATAFDSLQPALKVANNGDTVFIAKGTYLPTISAYQHHRSYQIFQPSLRSETDGRLSNRWRCPPH